MDRTTAPTITPLKSFDYEKAKNATLDNGLQVYYINRPNQEAVKIDFVFEAGYSLQEKPLQAAATAHLLEEGTDKRDSERLANDIEKEGALIDSKMKADTLELSLYCLASKIKTLLPIVLEIIEASTFPEEELVNFLENKRQKFNVNQQKVEFLVRNAFLSTLFGKNHPYNNSIEDKDFESLNRNDVYSFYKKHIKDKPFTIFISGKAGEKEISLLNQYFGKDKKLEADSHPSNFQLELPQPQNIFIKKEDASQAAIRIGKPIIDKKHADFPTLFFTNTLLGGFFGSRLMRNIREEKGYTYGIGSAVVSLKNETYLMIVSELGSDYLDDTLSEIKKEVGRLQEGSIPEEELQLVKNYLQGNLMKNFDGAFPAMDRYKSIHYLGLNYDYYDHLIQSFHQMTSEKIKNCAKKYLNFNDFHILVAGKNNYSEATLQNNHV